MRRQTTGCSFVVIGLAAMNDIRNLWLALLAVGVINILLDARKWFDVVQVFGLVVFVLCVSSYESAKQNGLYSSAIFTGVVISGCLMLIGIVASVQYSRNKKLDVQRRFANAQAELREAQEELEEQNGHLASDSERNSP